MTPMVPVDEYRRRITDSVRKLPARRIPLDKALGRIAAYDVHSHLDLPPFNASAMDGFALRAEDIAGASGPSPVSLRVVAEVRMGRATSSTVSEGQAIAVPTGGQVPYGADAVVPVEKCRLEGSTLNVREPCRTGTNVRLAGEDLKWGELVVPAGRRLRAMDLGMLASVGAGTARVVAAPRVGVISTGDELASPGQDLQPGQIYDSNAYLLRALSATLGARPVDCGRVRDDPGELMSALQQAAEQVDLLVCSGGVSAGSNDPVRRAVAEGLEAECVNVAMKPGRPQAFGQVMGTPLIAIPGNPKSALVSFEVFVRPALHKMMGLHQPEYTPAVAGEPLSGVTDRVFYVPMSLCETSSGRVARIASVCDAQGLARILPDVCLSPGDCVELLMLDTRL